MQFSSRQPPPIAMQLAPMIDILLLLLSFFIITRQLTRSETELSVSVPTAEEGTQKNRSRGEIIINILADGSVKVEGSNVNLGQLREKLTAVAKLWKNQPVRIRGDGNVNYQRIVEVIDTCQKSGIWNISFATQLPTPAK
ncbi:MAG: biopolymer transporter ExbD [Verrucomicrobiota bacterium]